MEEGAIYKAVIDSAVALIPGVWTFCVVHRHIAMIKRKRLVRVLVMGDYLKVHGRPETGCYRMVPARSGIFTDEVADDVSAVAFQHTQGSLRGRRRACRTDFASTHTPVRPAGQ